MQISTTCTVNVELIGLYPLPPGKNKKTPLATAHVYLPDLDLDIRGIGVFYSEGKYFIRLPHSKGWDPEAQKEVSFPIISSSNRIWEQAFKRGVIGCILKELKKNPLIKKRPISKGAHKNTT